MHLQLVSRSKNFIYAYISPYIPMAQCFISYGKFTVTSPVCVFPSVSRFPTASTAEREHLSVLQHATSNFTKLPDFSAVSLQAIFVWVAKACRYFHGISSYSDEGEIIFLRNTSMHSNPCVESEDHNPNTKFGLKFISFALVIDSFTVRIITINIRRG
jgi:hypothetical protein